MAMRIVVLFALLAHAVVALECRRAADCADQLRCTVDYCEPTENRCYNFPKFAPPCNGTSVAHTLASLRSEVDQNPLSPKERLTIVNAAITVIRDVHPHRDMHLALRGVDPVPDLQTLARDLYADVAANRSAADSNFDFHQAMIRAFNALDDIHTKYRAPAPLRHSVAVLPFLLRHYYVNEGDDADDTNDAGHERRYVVTDVANDFLVGNPAFVPGVRVVTFNHVDIDTAVQRSGADGVGANFAARILRGSRRLTRRFLHRQLAPQRKFATVGFLTENGHLQHVRLPWLIAAFPKRSADSIGFTAALAASTANSQQIADEFKAAIPSLVAMSNHMAPIQFASVSSLGSRKAVDVNPFVASHLSSEVITTKFGKLGMIRIHDFNSIQFFTFFEEVLKLLLAMKDHAVVIDVRGNNGGIVYLAQMTIQFFSENKVKPMQWSMRITDTIARLENAVTKLGKPTDSESPSLFTESIRYGMLAGDQFSGAFSLIDETVFREYDGERYNREMYVLTDAETYSSGDVFAAAVQDNEAAFVVGEDATTGAGGSSTVVYSKYLVLRCPDIFEELPGGVDFSLAFRRMNRVGPSSGIAVEHFGVTPNKRYYPTLRDRTEGDVDLHEFLAEFISARHNASRPAPSPATPPPNTTLTELVPLPSNEPDDS